MGVQEGSETKLKATSVVTEYTALNGTEIIKFIFTDLLTAGKPIRHLQTTCSIPD